MLHWLTKLCFKTEIFEYVGPPLQQLVGCKGGMDIGKTGSPKRLKLGVTIRAKSLTL